MVWLYISFTCFDLICNNTFCFCCQGEEEKGEDVDEDDDDGDGWMVPHGYLSEDEGCNEDDEVHK